MTEASDPGEGPLGIICCGGVLPYAVADAALGRGRKVILFAVRGLADTDRVKAYQHYWLGVGQFSRFRRITREHGCRELVFIGSARRPSHWQLALDFGTWKLLPHVFELLRGGDNHLLSGLVRIFESYGYVVHGAHEVAPEILVGAGRLAGRDPDAGERADIARGLAVLQAIGPYDVGQAVVVAANQVVAVEGVEGTDQMLARVAELRRSGRLRAPAGTGVLVKAPKPGQERRIDLPSIGPGTIEAAAQAGLAGIAVAAGSSIVAEAELFTAAAGREKIFVVGVRADGSIE